MINLVYIFVGIIFGAMGACLWLRGKSGKEIAVLKEKLNVSDSLKSELEQSNNEISVLRTQLTETRIAGEKDLVAAEEKLLLLENAKEQLAKEFENLANRIFEDKGSKLVGENRTKLEDKHWSGMPAHIGGVLWSHWSGRWCTLVTLVLSILVWYVSPQ